MNFKKTALISILTLSLSMGAVTSLTSCGSGKDESAGDWWVRPEGYQSEGISMFDVFNMPEGADTMVYYDANGQEAGSASVTWEDDSVFIDFGYTSVEWGCDGYSLYDPEDMEVEFVRTDDPGFEEMIAYEGKWYLNGNAESGEWIEFSGNQYSVMTSQYGEPSASESGTWEYGASVYMMQSGNQITALPQISTEFPGPTMYPVAGGKVIYLLDMFDYIAYVKEGVSADDPAIARMIENAAFFTGSWTAQMEDYKLQLTFAPDYFQIMAFAVDENGIENPNRDLGMWDGVWSRNDDETILLDFLDGTTESIPFTADATEITIQTVGGTFVHS